MIHQIDKDTGFASIDRGCSDDAHGCVDTTHYKNGVAYQESCCDTDLCNGDDLNTVDNLQVMSDISVGQSAGSLCILIGSLVVMAIQYN